MGRNELLFIQIILLVVPLRAQTIGKFPVSEFYGEVIKEAFNDNPFLYFSLIDNHFCSGSKKDKTFCACSPPCSKQGSCCIDYHWNDRAGWKNLNEYIDYFLQKQPKDISCERIIDRNAVPDNLMDNVYMVSKCSAWNKLRLRSDFMPVVGSNLVIYLNPTLAECHGVPEYKPLSVNISCSSPMLSTSMNIASKTASDCRYTLLDPGIATCSTHNICSSRKTPDKQQTLAAELCRKYTGKIVINGHMYHNVHCSKCAVLKKPYLVTIPERTGKNKQGIIPMLYSVSLNYGKPGLTAIYRSKGNAFDIDFNCQSNEVYDVIRKTCFTFQCGSGYYQEGVQCSKQEKTNKTTPEESDGIANKLLACLLEHPHGASLYILLQNETAFDYLNSELIHDNGSYKHYVVEVKSVKEIHALVETLKEKKINTSEFVITTYNHLVITRLYRETKDRGFSNNRFCESPKTLLKGNSTTTWLIEDFYTTNVNITSNCSIKIENETIPRNHFLPQIRLGLDGIISDYKVMTCDRFHLNTNCTRYNVRLTATDYKSLPNGSILLTKEGRVFTADEYTPTLTGISVCKDKFLMGKMIRNRPLNWVAQAVTVQSYLKLIGCSISILCYLFVIFVYMRAKDLRSIFGRNIVCVCISLLLSDITILLTTSTISINISAIYCHVIAVLLHYTLLSAHCWTSVITFEIRLTFPCVRKTSCRSNSNKRFAAYIFYGFIFSLFAVTSFAVLDSIGKLHIGYGIETCWINVYEYQIYLYLIPMGVMTSFNCFIILRILIKVYIQRKESEGLLKERDTNHKETSILVTALKLVLLVGLVEMIGFVHIPAQTNEFTKTVINVTADFLFVTFRSFRGLFIWTMYVFMDDRAWKRKSCRTSNSYSLSGSPVVTLRRNSQTVSARSSYRLTRNLDVNEVNV